MEIYIAFYVNDDDYYVHPEIRVYVGPNYEEALNSLRGTPQDFRDSMCIEVWKDGEMSRQDDEIRERVFATCPHVLNTNGQCALCMEMVRR